LEAASIEGGEMRRNSRAAIAALGGTLALSAALFVVPASADTTTASWDLSAGLRVTPGTETEIARLTVPDPADLECTVEVEATNGLSMHLGNNVNVYLNGSLLVSLGGVEDESFKFSTDSTGFTSSGQDELVVFVEATVSRRVSHTGKLTVTCGEPPPTSTTTTTEPPPTTTTTEPPGGGEGCTPGYWKQPHHFDSWVGHAPTDEFDVVFGVPYDVTLHTALRTGGGAEKALGRHAVAALLNAASPDVDFAFTEAEIIALVQDAWATGDFETAKDQLADANEQACPLN
jgi:hypothetical protein